MHVTPLRIEVDGAGRTFVRVHQVVRDSDGNVVREDVVQHVHQMDDALVTRDATEEISPDAA
jgi:hypothetical protein